MPILVSIALIIGGVLAVVLLRPQLLNKVREIKYMETTSVKDLLDMFNSMQEEGMGDHLRHYVELKGSVVCSQPIHTPFSERDVAFCASKLSAVSQREEHYQDEDGNMRVRMRRDEDVLTSETSADELNFKDSSSDISVVLDIKNGCSFDIPETLDRFEHTGNLSHYAYFRHFPTHSRANLLGYRMQEKTIALDQPLYVLGEAYEESGSIHIGKPAEKGKAFVVSTKSEDQMVGKYESQAKMALFCGMAAIAAGVILLVMKLLG